MCVFSSFLKSFKFQAFLMCSGRLFQTHGAVNVKALSPYVFNLAFGTTNWFLFDDLKVLVGSYSLTKSEIYTGLVPFSALKQIVAILYSILAFTGSQCSSSRSGVIWVLLLTLKISLAAEFCTLCSLFFQNLR